MSVHKTEHQAAQQAEHKAEHQAAQQAEHDARYIRQRALEEIGAAGQKKLGRASVLVVGCGALGSMQAQLLVRAGVGRLVLVDPDVVEASNLPRQMLFDEQDVAAGLAKVAAAVPKLKKINSRCHIEGEVTALARHNVEQLVERVDLVLDGTDNFETRYLLNDACVKASKPWIYGGVCATGGMVMAVFPGEGPCLRCVFESPPAAPTAAEIRRTGVLNTVPAVVAAAQVTRALHWIVDGLPVKGGRVAGLGLLTFDLWRNAYHVATVERNRDCLCCGQRRFLYLQSTDTAVDAEIATAASRKRTEKQRAEK